VCIETEGNSKRKENGWKESKGRIDEDRDGRAVIRMK